MFDWIPLQAQLVILIQLAIIGGLIACFIVSAKNAKIDAEVASDRYYALNDRRIEAEEERDDYARQLRLESQAHEDTRSKLNYALERKVALEAEVSQKNREIAAKISEVADLKKMATQAIHERDSAQSCVFNLESELQRKREDFEILQRSVEAYDVRILEESAKRQKSESKLNAILEVLSAN